MIKNSSPIYGERALGENVQMSDDGNTIISYSYLFNSNSRLGKVQVFENINGEWIQKGSSFIPTNADIQNDICISGDGNTVGMTHGSNFKVYKFNGTDWQIHDNNNSSTFQSSFNGESAFNYDGTVLAIGNINTYNNGLSNAGSASVYSLNSNDTTWSQIGNTIYGDVYSSWLGRSIDLNYDGSVFAVGLMEVIIVKDQLKFLKIFLDLGFKLVMILLVKILVIIVVME